MFNFDNTKAIKDFANSQKGQNILNDIPKGKQKQIYTVGQKVNANGITNAIITESYMQNGYCYYVIEYKVNRKTFTSRERQQDLQLLA